MVAMQNRQCVGVDGGNANGGKAGVNAYGVGVLLPTGLQCNAATNGGVNALAQQCNAGGARAMSIKRIQCFERFLSLVVNQTILVACQLLILVCSIQFEFNSIQSINQLSIVNALLLLSINCCCLIAAVAAAMLRCAQ